MAVIFIAISVERRHFVCTHPKCKRDGWNSAKCMHEGNEQMTAFILHLAISKT